MSHDQIEKLLHAVMYLDEVLKRGVLIGKYEDSMEIDDKDIFAALTRVRTQILNLNDVLEKLPVTLSKHQLATIQ